MDRGGGGRGTPRGRRGRGRGRGGHQAQADSPSSRAPSAPASPAQQSQSPSPSVSSSPASASSSSRDESKVTSVTATATAAEKPATMSTPPRPTSAPSPELKPAPAATPTTTRDESLLQKEEQEQMSESKPEPVLEKEPLKKSEELENEPPKEEARPVPVPVPEQSEVKKRSSIASSLEEPTIPPLLPEPVQPEPQASSPGATSTSSKVEEAIGKGHPKKKGKTLIVEPPEAEPSGSPLTVEIEAPVGVASSDGSEVPSGQGQGRLGGHTRSGSLSPAYPYALIAPVGKPGYIGGIGGILDDDGGDSGGRGGRPPAMIRRASAIAAVETAVKGFSKRQWILLIVFGLIDLLSAITISLQAPFYPAEAERKGANATEYGFVFGIFEFTVFLTSPLFGKYMSKLGAKTVFIVGILVSSLAVISFGLLDRIDDHTTFIALCLVCRCFEALGCAGFFTATFTIIACEFPASVSTTFASLETFFGLGLIVGPTVGGALYGVGGFPLPFFVVGALLLVTGLASSLIMPKIAGETDEERKVNAGNGILTILKIPTVALAALSIASTSMSLGFVSATLEPHIRMFNLTPFQTGLVFIINGGMYALTAPIFGYICDNIRRPIFVTIVGNVFIFVAFLIVGPASFMPFNTILWVTIVGLILQGLGFGCCLVSGFIVGLQDSIKRGLPDEISTYAIASGLWTSMISLGAWVGPVLAGILYDNFGFRQASWLVLCTSAVVGVTIFIHTCCDTQVSKSDSESQPLLRPISPLLGRKEKDESKTASSYGSVGGGGGEAV